jgi:hypothetical protein|tara:strand:+ start:92 stop:463 length:372 start_codon:yes stop_codon:yes gene_type:complete
MNNNYKLDISYIAGLFDVKGTISHRKKVWKMEMSMADRNVIELVHETLMVGTVKPKKVPTGMKPQWRWRCTFRDCLHVCKKLWPFAIVKLHKIEQVIDHYEPDIQALDDNVVDLAAERELRDV